MLENFAHVKWFTNNPVAVNPLNLGEWLLVSIIVIGGLAALGFVEVLLRKFGISAWLDKRLGRYAKIIPLVVRYSTAALLLINVVEGYLFAPNVTLGEASFDGMLALTMVAISILLISGRLLALAGWLLLAVYAFSLGSIRPIVDVLDHLEYLGIGLYLVLRSSEPYLKKVKASRLRQFKSPESLLRMGIGAGFVSMALSEKLVGIAHSYEFLVTHNWNLLRFFGVADRWFIIVAGAMELLVGLAIVLNIAPRVATLMVAGLMTITAVLLGPGEVYGHLFVLSLLVVVWTNPYVQTGKNKKRK